MKLDGVEYRNVSQNRSRHGQMRYYYRRVGMDLVRLPDPIDQPELFKAMHSLCAARSPVVAARLPSTSKSQKLKPEAKLRAPRKRSRHNPIYRIMWLVKNRAKGRGMPFNLTVRWLRETLIKQDYRCAISGLKLEIDPEGCEKHHPRKMSIDRINSAKGYTRENCRLVTLQVNLAINVWGLDVFMEMVDAVSGHKSVAPSPAQNWGLQAKSVSPSIFAE